jgi:hypothetical protein
VRVPGIATLATSDLLQPLGACPVCGRRIRFSSERTVNAWQTTITARCHGSTETVEIEDKIALDLDEYAWARRLVDWRRKLFALDLIPDVLELIRMNREGRGLIKERR